MASGSAVRLALVSVDLLAVLEQGGAPLPLAAGSIAMSPSTSAPSWSAEPRSIAPSTSAELSRAMR
ncbi:hypothetical protein [Sorangium sp. So ce854]|uniref:hypothetical protein n=1 Tax=Sorangium sp. So ce854 TaxID=3133322 RepID=UPI003F61A186